MFAVGHAAIGYLTGAATSKLLSVKTNVPLLLLASVLPDIDLLMGLEHRGPTHSLIIQGAFFLPAFLLFGKQAIPFFVSLAQHSLFGDLLTYGGIQLFWPIVSNRYGSATRITDPFNLSLEWTAFILFMAALWKTGHIKTLFEHHWSNLLLTIPVFAIVLPAFLSFPLTVPPELIVPHLILLIILGLSITTDLKQIAKLGH